MGNDEELIRKDNKLFVEGALLIEREGAKAFAEWVNNKIKKAREEEKKKYEPFRRFLRTLEVWAKTEIKIGKDYDIEKGQTASYGKGYDNALENVIEKIVKFQKERFKKLKSGREAEANTTGGRE